MTSQKEIRNTKTGTIGAFVCEYNRRKDGKKIYEVVAFASYGKNAHWLADNCEVVA